MIGKKTARNLILNDTFKKLILFIILVFVVVVYLRNLSSDVFGGDVGDLVTAAYFGGVPHPSGYPLFTMLGYFFSHLPFNASVVWKVGLISVFSSIGSLFFFYKLSERLTKNFLISILSMLILTFSYLFWFYTEIPEVFALNNFFAILIFYLAICFYQTKKIKYFYVLAFVIGLSFTHHQTIILVIPSVVFLLYRQIKKIIFNKNIVIISVPFFIVGLLPYLYVPFIGAHNPIVSWDDASNLKNFLHLIFRKDYGTFSAGDFPSLPATARFIILKDYFNVIMSSISAPVFLISLLGLYKAFRTDRKIFTLFLLAFLITGPVFNFYAGFPVLNVFMAGISERFYVLSSVILLFFVPYGFLLIRNILSLFFVKKIYANSVFIAFFIIPAMLFRNNFLHTDLSKTHIGENFARDILTSLPRNSLLFLQSDTIILNTFYVNQVLGFRPDVYVANPGHPGDVELLKIEKDGTLENTLVKLKEKRPIFTNRPIELKSKNLIWVPKGLLHELSLLKDLKSKGKYLEEVNKIWDQMYLPLRFKLSLAERNPVTSSVLVYYSNALVETGSFITLQYNNSLADAAKYYREAVDVDNENARAYGYLAVSEYNLNKNCKSAEENLKKAIFYDPNSKVNFGFLYMTYKRCNKNKKTLADLKNQYYIIFNEDIKKIEKEIQSN